jgi:proteic killer suppression protein
VIKTFRGRETELLFRNLLPKQFVSIERAARKKLNMVAAAGELSDLRIPPGNRLEKLHGDREGQYSVRINDRWRICFVWHDGDAYDVEIVDYH